MPPLKHARRLLIPLLLIGLGSAAMVSWAAASESAAVVCNDGSTSAHGGRGACSSHGGVNTNAAAPGAGPGMVWVNTSSKVYHCPTDRDYGKTKHGKYMSEADAKAQGYRADHNKACSSGE